MGSPQADGSNSILIVALVTAVEPCCRPLAGVPARPVSVRPLISYRAPSHLGAGTLTGGALSSYGHALYQRRRAPPDLHTRGKTGDMLVEGTCRDIPRPPCPFLQRQYHGNCGSQLDIETL